MRMHPRALANEGITPERYQELQSVCRQYPYYARRARRARAGIVDTPKRRSGAWRRPDPTGNTAASLADLLGWESARMKLIETCARQAGGSAVAPSILESVTEGRGFDVLRRRAPCGRRQFYVLRLGFYVLLDARLREQR